MRSPMQKPKSYRLTQHWLETLVTDLRSAQVIVEILRKRTDFDDLLVVKYSTFFKIKDELLAKNKLMAGELLHINHVHVRWID